jgi:hypothetical protein
MKTLRPLHWLLALATLLSVLTFGSVPASAKSVCPTGQVRVMSGKKPMCVKPKPTSQRVYTGPVVVNGLPFSTVKPTVTSPEALARLFAADATSLANCSAIFPSCAVKVWGRKDPWNLKYEGRAAEYFRPWVPLFEKYRALGADIYQNLAETGSSGFAATDPAWAGYYRFELAGQVFHFELVSSTMSSKPSQWLVPGCRACMAFQLLSID